MTILDIWIEKIFNYEKKLNLNNYFIIIWEERKKKFYYNMKKKYLMIWDVLNSNGVIDLQIIKDKIQKNILRYWKSVKIKKNNEA